MLTRIPLHLSILLVLTAANTILAQSTTGDFEKLLRQKASFQEEDLATLKSSQPVVRLAPSNDKREVAVSGLVGIQAGADEFLNSYRNSLISKENPAVLEAGRFGREPALGDLEGLTLDARDIEDLKKCVVGACPVKLSAAMIERFRQEIDWNAPNYPAAATSLFRQMMLDYVRDYRARGAAALLEYNDKREVINVAAEQRALDSAPSYVSEFFANAELQPIEEAIVWSKIKFGLKPVIAVSHISIYRPKDTLGPQVLISSKQIYANHYFNASLALTAFVRVSDSGSYLVYENRSRADGLDGPFGKLKRSVVEKKALEGLREILAHSKASLEGSPLTAATTEITSYRSYGWGHRLFGGIRPLLWVLTLSALIALMALGKRRAAVAAAPKKGLKIESASS